MDLRTRTSLFCGALAIAIAVSILLRRRPGLPQIWFAAFAGDTGLWYFAQWLYHFVRADVWARFTAVLAAFLPQFALRLFEALVPVTEQEPALTRVANILLVPVLLLALLGPLSQWWIRGIVFLYVFGLLGFGLWSLWARNKSSRSRGTQRRVRFLVLMGALAVLATLADFLWFLGVQIPPIGAVFSIVFLFMISESLIRQRFVDIYDVLGQVTLSAALASLLAAIFYVFVGLFGGFDTMYLTAFLATIVILVVFEPLREKTNLFIHRTFFRERADLDRAVSEARREMAHVLKLDQLAPVVLGVLEESRRVTAAALYVRDIVRPTLELVQSFGPGSPERIEQAMIAPLLERFEGQGSIVLDDVEASAEEAKRRDDSARFEKEARILEAANALGPFRRGVLLALRGGDGGLAGVLALSDDRAQDAFAADEVLVLEELARSMGVVLENSRQFQKLQMRDRLAVLGQMAAGLAHEVKNPLGAIKGAAELLDDGRMGESEREFVSIILEEVARLDRVVGSVLDYARPPRSHVGEVDVPLVLRKTANMLEKEGGDISFVVEAPDELPDVRGDAEQLRQVLINLIRNAMQAMEGRGTVKIGAALSGRVEGAGTEAPYLAITVTDDGPGIAPEMMDKLFVPFVTTKERGTGLGLAICQRIVQEMRGRIEVRSKAGVGTTFSVLLPVIVPPAVPFEVRAPASVRP